MTRVLDHEELLTELDGTLEANLNRHLSMAKEWHPHDYVPWDLGRNFAAMGGEDWSLEQSSLSELARTAMITNLLTEDNLPSYHRGLADNFSLDGAWGTWVGRWTAEENRHGIVMRDYLVVTRAVDPVELERARMHHMTVGVDAPMDGSNFLHSVAYVTFQELATRVSHRNTGLACGDPIADRMLARVAADENLHMIFYRNLGEASLDLVPDQMVRAIADVATDFQMPGLNMPNFRKNAMILAKHGIYDLRQHLDEVLMPVLRKWNIFERNDFSGEGERDRDRLAAFVQDLEAKATKFEESRDRLLAREAARAEKAS
ncbi:acyl-ACP desaturase [Rhodococcus fascians]|jgi:acyl-[acyl-carrier-protein] desaturase|nr:MULTISPECIES: acyl-ACP desaturase [Rhodococcus]AMY53178.1 Putative acyl-[acyl-carrier-protein] desaturase desA1 [Rhodococcus fascians D188]KJV02241.1 putative acyl-[acyl-carrier-protein] desaturase DesA1 [Rhodococcus sp. PML026]MBJ7352729.1 acyl-ACP desaturase [Rhodococcus sp. (in: high G+C Gram-positive bacteria)]MBM7245717.1 acyl-ACP desaturase [Rhodococcus fascians]MBX5333531.1 acyl-ACP desaturase [Rhodococcus fascians]